jgi:hypothetical protein
MGDKHGSLAESLSYPSTAGLDEQRQSMVLELYCKKAEGEREREREREKLSPCPFFYMATAQ